MRLVFTHSHSAQLALELRLPSVVLAVAQLSTASPRPVAAVVREPLTVARISRPGLLVDVVAADLVVLVALVRSVKACLVVALLLVLHRAGVVVVGREA